jgi:phosphatidylethanolamine-binding protein (PEBP) family uncharacterized protein
VAIRHLSTIGALVLVIALAGCGGASVPAAKPKIAFVSPAVTTTGVIPASYKCNGNNIWLPLQWGALPADTKELVIYVARFGQPEGVPGGTAKAALIAQQLIVGLKPSLHRLKVGNLPHGALIGYYEIGNKSVSICPKKGSTQGILFGLYALPHPQNIGKGSQSGSLLNKLRAEAEAVGTFTAAYART